MTRNAKRLAVMAVLVALLSGCAFIRGLLGIPTQSGDSPGQYGAGQAAAAGAQTLVPAPFSHGIAVVLGLLAAFENWRQRKRAGERDAMIRAAQDVKATLSGDEARKLIDAIRTRATDSGVAATLHAAYKKLFPADSIVKPK